MGWQMSREAAGFSAELSPFGLSGSTAALARCGMGQAVFEAIMARERHGINLWIACLAHAEQADVGLQEFDRRGRAGPAADLAGARLLDRGGRDAVLPRALPAWRAGPPRADAGHAGALDQSARAGAGRYRAGVAERRARPGLRAGLAGSAAATPMCAARRWRRSSSAWRRLCLRAIGRQMKRRLRRDTAANPTLQGIDKLHPDMRSNQLNQVLTGSWVVTIPVAPLN